MVCDSFIGLGRVFSTEFTSAGILTIEQIIFCWIVVVSNESSGEYAEFNKI